MPGALLLEIVISVLRQGQFGLVFPAQGEYSRKNGKDCLMHEITKHKTLYK